jgi:hypothetical protein
MIKQSELQTVMVRAQEFLNRCNDYLRRGEFITGTKESGAMRRSSLDLTRALTQMRKPQ